MVRRLRSSNEDQESKAKTAFNSQSLARLYQLNPPPILRSDQLALCPTDDPREQAEAELGLNLDELKEFQHWVNSVPALVRPRSPLERSLDYFPTTQLDENEIQRRERGKRRRGGTESSLDSRSTLIGTNGEAVDRIEAGGIMRESTNAGEESHGSERELNCTLGRGALERCIPFVRYFHLWLVFLSL